MGRATLLLLLCLLKGITAFAQQTSADLPLAEVAGDSSSMVAGCVNVTTGSYTNGEVDIIIPGAQPVSFQRLYCSADWIGQGLSDGWNHNYLPGLASIGQEGGKYAIFIPESSGGKLAYKSTSTALIRKNEEGKHLGLRAPPSQLSFAANLSLHDEGMTNTSMGEIGGSTNLKNQTCEYSPRDSLAKVTLCDGGQRFFCQVNKSFMCPIYLLPERELLPNGNQIFYEYAVGKLSKIRVTDSSGERTYGSFEISPVQNGKKTITASDGQQAVYEMHSSLTRQYIRQVTRSNGPQETFHYSPYKSAAAFKDQEKVIKKELPEGGYQKISYYHEGENHVNGDRVVVKSVAKDGNHIGSVKALEAPVGPGNSNIITHRFFYHFEYAGQNRNDYLDGSHVTVRDVYNRQTIYQLLRGKRLGSIERFTGNSNSNYKLYSKERFYWGERANNTRCNLICKAIEDPNGNILSARFLEYDARHNVTSDNILGDLSGSNTIAPLVSSAGVPAQNGCEHYTITYTYSNDKFNLRLSESYPN
jgi:hypothetical protein